MSDVDIDFGDGEAEAQPETAKKKPGKVKPMKKAEAVEEAVADIEPLTPRQQRLVREQQKIQARIAGANTRAPEPEPFVPSPVRAGEPVPTVIVKANNNYDHGEIPFKMGPDHFKVTMGVETKLEANHIEVFERRRNFILGLSKTGKPRFTVSYPASGG